jgi:hypothetical protein
MKDLIEQVQTLEKQLDELSDVFDSITKSLTRERERGCGKERRSVSKTVQSERPWVKGIVRSLKEISTELRTVKEALGTRSFTDSGIHKATGRPRILELRLGMKLSHNINLRQSRCLMLALKADSENQSSPMYLRLRTEMSLHKSPRRRLIERLWESRSRSRRRHQL